VVPDGPYAAVEVTPSTGSTNADLVAAARAGTPDRTVLIAEEQTAGRGRLSRTWVSPPGSGLYLSVLLRPQAVPVARWGTLALVAGVALARVAREVAGVDAVLKWPNDLLAGPERAKCGGVLSEVAADGTAVVVGIGVNVAHLPVEVPPGVGALPATSLADAGARIIDRTTLADALLVAFDELEAAWRAAGGDLERCGVLAAYREACATLGSRVLVEMPSSVELAGVAVDVTPGGELTVKADNGLDTTVSAGDVVHVRAGD
jgi:BirA family biotin operon repressor/biotin-[acetyl-CoA-carboxylase] ligase